MRFIFKTLFPAIVVTMLFCMNASAQEINDIKFYYSEFCSNNKSIFEPNDVETRSGVSLRSSEGAGLTRSGVSLRSSEGASLKGAGAGLMGENGANGGAGWHPTRWFIKSNLLFDIGLMPSLEVEYRISKNWSVAVEGNVAWWKNEYDCKYYQLATIIPEVRCWFGVKKARQGHYIGLFAGGGWYDLENGGTGYMGEGFLVGLGYGYMFPIGKHFAFEAGIGLGYMNTWYDVYEPDEGHFVYQESRKLDYSGPIKLKFAFVWNISTSRGRGGAK